MASTLEQTFAPSLEGAKDGTTPPDTPWRLRTHPRLHRVSILPLPRRLPVFRRKMLLAESNNSTTTPLANKNLQEPQTSLLSDQSAKRLVSTSYHRAHLAKALGVYMPVTTRQRSSIPRRRTTEISAPVKVLCGRKNLWRPSGPHTVCLDRIRCHHLGPILRRA